MSYWIVGLGIYITGTVILFIFPSLIHKKRDYKILNKLINGKLKIISHRGGMEKYPENSLSSFKNSVEIGCFGVELDVHTTLDGKLIICHDKNLKRITNQVESPEELNYDQIKNYQKNIWDENIQEYFHYEDYIIEKPPLFEDLLRNFKNNDLYINIDIKSNKESEMLEVIKLIHKYEIENNVVIGFSLNSKAKEIIKNYKMDIPTFCNVKELLLFVFGSIFLFLPFVSFKNDVVCITGNFNSTKNSNAFKNSFLKKLLLKFTDLMSPLYKIFVWHMNRRGIPVVLWTLNCHDDWEKGIKRGVNGIMTDYPLKLINYLD